MYKDDVLAYREEKDAAFKSDASSPLTSDQKRAFTGLSYFDVDESLNRVVEVQEFDLKEKSDVQIHTTKGETRWYRRWGKFEFDLNGQMVALILYQTPHGFFLPFVDANKGISTYPAGRYLDPEQIDDHTFHVDFNLAYNPFCAYNEKWSCPITPSENHLSVVIEAGEKIPSDEWL